MICRRGLDSFVLSVTSPATCANGWPALFTYCCRPMVSVIVASPRWLAAADPISAIEDMKQLAFHPPPAGKRRPPLQPLVTSLQRHPRHRPRPGRPRHRPPRSHGRPSGGDPQHARRHRLHPMGRRPPQQPPYRPGPRRTMRPRRHRRGRHLSRHPCRQGMTAGHRTHTRACGTGHGPHTEEGHSKPLVLGRTAQGRPAGRPSHPSAPGPVDIPSGLDGGGHRAGNGAGPRARTHIFFSDRTAIASDHSGTSQASTPERRTPRRTRG